MSNGKRLTYLFRLCFTYGSSFIYRNSFWLQGIQSSSVGIHALHACVYVSKNPPPHTLKRRSLGGKRFNPGDFSQFHVVLAHFLVSIDLMLRSTPSEASFASLLAALFASSSMLIDGQKAPSKNSPSCCVGNELGSSNSSKRKKGSGVKYEVA